LDESNCGICKLQGGGMTKLQRAVLNLTTSLKEDKDYYRGWRDNISMAFQDELKRSGKRRPSSEDLRTVANKAADNFLKLLMN
jgi:hypothetical protein